MIHVLETADLENTFGVREVLIKCPALIGLIFNEKLRRLLRDINPNPLRLIKSIYFNKPPRANWIVNWHQDLTINLQTPGVAKGYQNWRTVRGRTVVQPNQELLENIFTVRIHLDNCTAANGALRVIESSHRNGVVNLNEWTETKPGIERICEVPKGGVLVMRPLLLHASRRTTNEQQRRVLHLEFTDQTLPDRLAWKEAITHT